VELVVLLVVLLVHDEALLELVATWEMERG